MANECRVANLLISHLRKGEGRAIHSAMGSIGFVGQCRVAWAITKCPTNPKRRLMTCIKNNLADDTTGLAFTIEPYGPDEGPVLAWEAEPVRMSADQAMDQLRKPRGRKPDARNNAADWLSKQLAAGPKPAADILDEADNEGFKPWTVRRAFNQLECKRWKDGFDEGWVWAMPEDVTFEDNTEEYAPEDLSSSHLRKNTEDYVQKKKNNQVTREKVTDCERADSVTFEGFERAELNGHGDNPF
jgi:hypothetical protein